MNFKKSFLVTSMTAAIFSAVSAEAAQPELFTRVFGTGSSNAAFRGGATISNGANFLSSIPSGQKAGIWSTITPPAADVGAEADLYMVINAGDKWYMRNATGFVEWTDLKVSSLVSYQTKTLAAAEAINVMDLETMAGQNFDGKTLRVHVGYMTSTSPLVYSSAMEFGLANAPSSTCPVGSGSLPPVTAGGNRLCVLTGTVTNQDIHLTNNFDYILSGAVFIGGDNKDSASITIDPGVTVYGESGNDFLVIRRGSKIHVNGTPSAPVIMTSGNDASATASTRGQWGGLIINGNAPINGCSEGTAVCEAEGEGSTGLYGGNNPDDSSGNLNYLQVKYAGFEITPDNELNGIAFQGVGRGTVVDYVQVHNNSDDGVEFFGGTVDAKHLYLSGIGDDSVDWTKGWTGRLQHVVVVQTDRGDQGIEADSNSSNRDSLPRAKPTISNITLIGNSNTDQGMLLREGTGAVLSNLIVTGFGDDCIDIDHAETFAAAGGSIAGLNGTLSINSAIASCTTTFREEAGDAFTVQAWFEAGSNNSTTNPGMTSYINSTVANGITPTAPSDPWFDTTDYIGAVKDSASDWTVGWTYKD
jgi:hypothetical protein